MGQQGVCVGLVLFWGCREGWMLKEVGAGSARVGEATQVQQNGWVAECGWAVVQTLRMVEWWRVSTRALR